MKRVSGNLVSNIYLLLILWHSFIFSCSLLHSLSPSHFPMFFSQNWILFLQSWEGARWKGEGSGGTIYCEHKKKRESSRGITAGRTHSIEPKATRRTSKLKPDVFSSKRLKNYHIFFLHNMVIVNMSWVNTKQQTWEKKSRRSLVVKFILLYIRHLCLATNRNRPDI